MNEPLFLTSVFQERIWGGTALRDEYGYSIPSNQTGEYWAISAHPNGPSVIENGVLKGKNLIEVWNDHPALFGHSSSPVFPLLTKILDANSDLSVQVHPDDQYAAVHENGELGKTECWYIIDCKEDADMIFGHTARTKEELTHMIEDGKWDSLLQRVKIKPGDFFYVPSGTIHALCEGTLVLETQQSSDTTYRVYDYDRKDAAGQTRELHLEKAIDVTTVPHEGEVVTPTERTEQGLVEKIFVESDFFSVYKWNVSGDVHRTQSTYQLLSVLNGSGQLTVDDGDSYTLQKGQHIILPATIERFSLSGNLELLVSHE